MENSKCTFSNTVYLDPFESSFWKKKVNFIKEGELFRLGSRTLCRLIEKNDDYIIFSLNNKTLKYFF